MSDYESDPRKLSDDATESARNVGDDIAMLRADVAALVKQVKELALREGARLGQDAADRITDTASTVYDNVSRKGRRSCAAVSQHVEEQPVQSLLLAFAAGFIFSKIFTRR